MDMKTCKSCELCITFNGRTRCGLGAHGYKYISENDPACEHFEPFEPLTLDDES